MTMAGIGVSKSIDCPICLEAFKDPRVLPCGHTFCLDCIKRHGESKDSNPACPICRETFQIPSNGFEALTRNYCLGSGTSVLYGSANTDDVVTEVNMTKRLCKKHTDEELKHYCVECSEVICDDCRDEDHRKHDCYKISRFEKEARTQLEGFVKSIKPILSQVTRNKCGVEEESVKFFHLLDVTELAINEEYEKKKRLLDNHKRLLLEELSNEKHKVTKGLKMKTVDIETERLGLSSFSDSVERILQGTNEEATFNLVFQYKDLKDSFEKLKRIQAQAMGQVSVKSIEFIPGNFNKFFNTTDNMIGRLYTESDLKPKERKFGLRKDLTPSIKQVDLSLSQRLLIDPHVWYYVTRKHKDKLDSIAQQHLCVMKVVCDSSNVGITHNLEVAPYARDDSKEASKHVDDAVEEFAQLYQKISELRIFKESISIPVSLDQNEMERLIAELEATGVFCLRSDDPFLRSDDPCLIGPKASIEKVKQKVSDFVSGRNNSSERVQPSDSFNEAQASAADRVQPLKFKTSNGLTVHVAKGDLVHQSLDAIVNPANEDLRHGGGAARAIADAAGYVLERESKEFIMKYGKLGITHVMHTSAGKLRPKIKYVIHTVGPRKSKEQDDEDLFGLFKRAVFNCLCYANDELKIHSVAIPAISSGIFGVPIEIVGRASYEALKMFDQYYASSKKKSLCEIHFLNKDQETFSNMKRIIQTLIRDKVFFPMNSLTLTCDLSPEKASADVAGKKADKAGDDKKEDEDNHCIICMDEITDKKELGCKHKFCRECIDDYFTKCQPKCPTCGKVFGIVRGDQPKGTMTTREISWLSLRGYSGYGTIEVQYSFYDGVQGEEHPNPGQPYKGTRQIAYLPGNKEGREVLRLLKRAFDAGLVFTIGRSNTTGQDNVVIWSDIHHKTSQTGPDGYPDPTYLKRVKEQLAAVGIQ